MATGLPPNLQAPQTDVSYYYDLKAWPWVALAGPQFWGTKEVKLMVGQALQISPVLISKGVTSTREAVRAGLGVAILPDWMIEDDLRSGRLVRVLPKCKTKDLPIHVVYLGQSLMPARVGAFIDFAVSYLTKELAASRTVRGHLVKSQRS